MRMAANWFDYDVNNRIFSETTFICKTKIPHAMIKEFHSCEDNSNEEWCIKRIHEEKILLLYITCLPVVQK